MQRRDGDVAVAKGGDVGVVLGVAEGKDAAVPEVTAATGVLALFVGVGPGADTLADDFDARGLLVRAEGWDVYADDPPAGGRDGNVCA